MAEIVWKDKKRTLFGLPISFTEYSLDKERFFVKTGFMNLVENEVRLYRITDLSLSQTLGQRIFGLGTIHCCSSDKTLKNFDILNIKNPKATKEILSELVQEQRDEKRVASRELLIDEDEDEVDE